MIEKRRRARTEERQRNAASQSLGQFSVSFAYPFDLGPAFGADFKISMGKNAYVGFQGFFGESPYSQIEMMFGVRIPINVGKAILTPFADIGAGIINTSDFGDRDFGEPLFVFGISAKGGVMLRPIPTSGFFIQTAFQYNLYRSGNGIYPAILIAGVGYAF